MTECKEAKRKVRRRAGRGSQEYERRQNGRTRTKGNGRMKRRIKNEGGRIRKMSREGHGQRETIKERHGE